jgi:hypothetical protein
LRGLEVQMLDEAVFTDTFYDHWISPLRRKVFENDFPLKAYFTLVWLDCRLAPSKAFGWAEIAGLHSTKIDD